MISPPYSPNHVFQPRPTQPGGIERTKETKNVTSIAMDHGSGGKELKIKKKGGGNRSAKDNLVPSRMNSRQYIKKIQKRKRNA
jgi:hypothetical protein